MSLEESFRLRKIYIISVGITVDLNLEFSTFNSILFEGRRSTCLFIEIFLRVNRKRFEIEMTDLAFQPDYTSKFCEAIALLLVVYIQMTNS